MKTISTREMRAILSQLDEVLTREGELVITRRGRPIARLLPPASVRAMPTHADLRARMPRSPVPSEELVRQDRDER